MLTDVALWMSLAGQFMGLPIGNPLPGFKLTELKPGTGIAAKAGDVVTLHFVAKVEKGKELASTEKLGLPYRFRVGSGEVPVFFEVCVGGMRVGGERKAIVPPEYGYGPAAAAIVPPKATLDVWVKLVKID